MKDRKIGFGIIGTGSVASTHAAAIRDMDDAILVGVYNSTPLKGKAFAEKYGVKCYSTLDDLLSDCDIDIVTIATPSGAHLDAALDAVNHKKHVIIEKPMEITSSRIALIIKAAEENGVILSGIFQSRFYEASKIVKKAVDEGRFGRITLIDAQIKWYRSQEYYDSGAWRGTWKLDGGGVLMNQGIHAIDLLCWLGGDVESVSAMCTTLGHKNIEVEDTAGAVLKFKSGAIGVIEATTSCYPGFPKRIEILGTEGSAVLEEENIKSWSFKDEREEDAVIRERFMKSRSSGGAADPTAIDFKGHRKVFEDVVSAVKNGTGPSLSGAESGKSVALIEAIYKSSREHREIKL